MFDLNGFRCARGGGKGWREKQLVAFSVDMDKRALSPKGNLDKNTAKYPSTYVCLYVVMFNIFIQNIINKFKSLYMFE